MRQLLIVAVLSSLAAGCGQDIEITDAPLAGVVAGANWEFAAGHTSAFLTDDDEFFAVLYDQAVEPCSFGPQVSHLIVSVPMELGDHGFGPRLNMTFVEFEGDSTPLNLIATDGAISVLDITADTIVAGLHGIYDDDNEVDGMFEITICDDD